MKTNKIIIGAAVLTGAMVFKYLLKNRKTLNSVPQTFPAKKTHHITDVFAQAKKHVAE
jgi:hypothetical protein